MRLHLLVSALALPVFASLVISGCSDSDPTGPHSDMSPVQITLDVSSHEGNPDHPISLVARAWRSGADPIMYYQDCCTPAVWVDLTDPAGNTVLTEQQLFCGCPSVPYELDSDGVVTEQLFDGTVWENGTSRREAVPGHYLVTARFTYHTPPLSGLFTTVTITRTFQWNSPSS